MSAKSDDNRFFYARQKGWGRHLGARWAVRDTRPLSPFSNGLLVDTVALCQRPQAHLTMLLRSTCRLCVVALPCRTSPIAPSFYLRIRSHDQSLGSNSYCLWMNASFGQIVTLQTPVMLKTRINIGYSPKN